jgi:hypothetical protein
MAFVAEIVFRENGVSTNSAEQPATRDNTEGSVEQSAHTAPIKTLVDLRHWVENLHEADRRTSPVCRVRDALRVLELDPSRDARKHLQALLKSWDIKQKEPSGKKRFLKETDYEQWDDQWGRSAVEQPLKRCSATVLNSVMQTSAVVSEAGHRSSEPQAVLYIMTM